MKDYRYIEYAKHIRDEIEFIQTRVKELDYTTFNNDETLKRAFVRSIEIIGEATKKISV